MNVSGLLKADWFAGFLSGVAATILGFLLTIIWDIRKAKRESRRHDKAVLTAITEELLSNKRYMEQNVARLNVEVPVLGENKSLIQPLFTLKTGFWDLAKVNLPKELLRGNMLARLRDLVFIAEQANEEIRSRESYRTHNRAMSSFSDTMKLYDESLVRGLESLAQSTAAYDGEARPSRQVRTLSRFFQAMTNKTGRP